jgi:membrane protein
MRQIIDLIKQTFKEWQEDKASRLAAALAFYAILSIPPLLVLAIAIVGQFTDEAAARETILSQVGQLMGGGAREAVAMILEAAAQPEGLSWATAVSLAVLFFSASGVFVQLQEALNTIWDVMPEPGRGILHTVQKRAVSFLMVIGIGGLLLLMLLLSSLIAVLDQVLTQVLPFSVTWAKVLNYGLSFLIITGLIALVYKTIPDVEIVWRDVWVGAVVTAVLFALGVAGISIYTQVGNPTSGYGAAGSLIILLIWVYYSAQIVFLGAEFTQVYANRFGHYIRPDDHAVYMPGTQPTPEQQRQRQKEKTA